MCTFFSLLKPPTFLSKSCCHTHTPASSWPAWGGGSFPSPARSLLVFIFSFFFLFSFFPSRLIWWWKLLVMKAFGLWSCIILLCFVSFLHRGRRYPFFFPQRCPFIFVFVASAKVNIFVIFFSPFASFVQLLICEDIWIHYQMTSLYLLSAMIYVFLLL